MTVAIVDFLHDLEKSENILDCFTALTKSVEALGYDAVSYAAMPLSILSSTQTPIFLSSRNFNESFLSHYLDENLIEHDFTVERISQGRMDVMDWTKELEKKHLTNEQENVINIAKFDYGIQNAVSIPTQSNEELIAGCSFTSENNSKQFQILNTQNLGTLKAVAQLFHDRIFANTTFRQHFYLPILQQFSKDELHVISLIVGGHRLKMSQELCGISPTRAGNILSALYKRYGLKNASELAYLVGVHKLIESL